MVLARPALRPNKPGRSDQTQAIRITRRTWNFEQRTGQGGSISTFDAIVIGTGQAGPPLAHRLAGAGMRVAIVERHRFGGTCVNTGCTPTKTLVASAYAAHLARRAGEDGVPIDAPGTLDMKRVKARKDEIAGRSNKGGESWLRGLKNCTVYQGHGRFESPRHVQVNDEILEAQKIFINVGGRALVPPLPGLEEVSYFTNSSMMEV